MGTGPTNSSRPTTSIPVAGTYNVTTPAPADQQAMSLQVDNEGNLLVSVVAGGGGASNASVGPTGVPAPTSATEIGIIVGGNLVGVSAANPLPITGTISASNPSVGLTGAAAPTSATEIGIVNGAGNLQNVSPTNPLPANIIQIGGGAVSLGQKNSANSIPVVLATDQSAIPVTLINQPSTQLFVAVDNFPAVQPISGTVITTPPANASTNITQVGGSAVSLGQKTSANSIPVVLATDQSAIPVTLINQPSTQLFVAIDSNALVNQTAPVNTEGSQVLLSEDLNGNTRVILGGVPTAVQKAAFSSTGSVSSLACAFPNPVKKGNTLIVVVAVGVSNTPTVADTLGNVYILTGAYQVGPANAFGIGTFWCKSKSAGANTITVTNSGAAASMAAEIYEVTGLAPGVVPEAFSANAATSASATLGASAVQTMPNGFMIAGVAVGTATQNITLPVATSVPFTEILTNDSGQVNPTTPAGLFSFAAGSGVSPLQQTFATNAPLALLAGSEPWALTFCVFRPYIQAIAGVTTIAGQGTAPLITNIVPVAIVDGNAPPDGTATSGAVLAPNGTHQVLSVGMWVATDGSNIKFAGLRTPTVFKTISTQATGNTAVWTPTGKKFRLMRFMIDVMANALTAGGNLTISLNDAGTALNANVPAASNTTNGGVSFTAFVPSSAITNVFGGYSTGWIDLGNGYISAAAGNALNINLSAAVTVGLVNIIVCGTEE